MVNLGYLDFHLLSNEPFCSAQDSLQKAYVDSADRLRITQLFESLKSFSDD